MLNKRKLRFISLLQSTICEGGVRRSILLSSPLSPCWKSRFTSTPCFSLSVRFRFLSQLCAAFNRRSLFFFSYQLKENCCFVSTRVLAVFPSNQLLFSAFVVKRGRKIFVHIDWSWRLVESKTRGVFLLYFSVPMRLESLGKWSIIYRLIQ